MTRAPHTEADDWFAAIQKGDAARIKHLLDAGTVLVRGVKDKGDIIGRPEMEQAYQLGLTIE